ncbi:MAG: hypothetical protein AAB967_03785, partial [Patescibacteria group bacterium]
FHSVRWYPRQDSVNSDPLPNGQDGSAITAGGISLGDIKPGWDSQGYLVVRFLAGGSTAQGQDFSLLLSPAGTQTLSRFGQMTYAVSVAPINGFTAPVS